MWDFEPDERMTQSVGMREVEVPYFEDALADWAPYYSSEKNIKQAKVEVADALATLGGVGVAFQGGVFNVEGKRRHGYVIRFQYMGAPSLLRVAGLPIKHEETQHKVERVRVQALLNVRDQRLAAMRAPVFAPGLDPLIPLMLVDHEKQATVMDLVNQYIERGYLPGLPPPEREGGIKGDED